MKKIKQKVSLLLMAIGFVVVLSQTSIAKAETVSTDENMNVVTKLDTHYITTGNEEDSDTYNSYFISSDGQMATPITITKKGTLYFAVATTSEEYPSVKIYADAACATTPLGSAYISSSNYDTGLGMYVGSSEAYIEKAGTYYIKVNQVANVLFMSQLFNGSDRTLKNKTWTASYTDYAHDDIYYKYKASKNGYLTVKEEFIDVDGSGTGNADITLCNNKKKEITENVYTTTSQKSNQAVFAVKKGKTYYIKVSSSYAYRIKSSFTSVADTSGSKKAKAKTLAFGKAATGLIFAEDKTSAVDYYKFTLTSACKPTFILKGNATGTIYFDVIGTNIYGGSGYAKINDYGYKGSSKIQLSDNRNLPKGTYYIKVYKDYDKDATGNYSITIKK